MFSKDNPEISYACTTPQLSNLSPHKKWRTVPTSTAVGFGSSNTHYTLTKQKFYISPNNQKRPCSAKKHTHTHTHSILVQVALKACVCYFLFFHQMIAL